jgi:hypothetical protein
MSKTTKFIAAVALSVSLTACVAPDRQTQLTAGGAALGASAAAIAGGNTSQVIAGGIVGATAGALIPAN